MGTHHILKDGTSYAIKAGYQHYQEHNRPWYWKV